MEIVSRQEIGLVPPSQTLPAMSSPEGWIAHWVGSGGLSAAPTRNESFQVWRTIQSESMAGIRGQVYIDVPYSFGVDPMGLILEGRGWEHTNAANGSASYNNHAWSACLLAGPGMPLTFAAKAALTWLTQQGAARSGAVSYVKPHSAIFQTQCPGPDLFAFCPQLQATLHGAPAPSPVEDSEDMIILAPAHQQHDPNRPAFAALDKNNKLVVLRNGAAIRQPVHIPSNTPLIGWCETPGGFVVTADTGPGLSGYPAFHFEFA